MFTSLSVIALVIAVAAVLIIKTSPNIRAWWAMRNIISPTHVDSGIYKGSADFICYLRDTPYAWSKNADGQIVGVLDRGFGWYYQVEWHPDNTLIALSGRAGLIATRARVSIGFNSNVTNAGLTRDFEWLYQNARMKEALANLTALYPGRPLFKLPEKYPAEIIVELERTKELSRAIAVISQSDEHHHNVMMETYKVLRGQLSVFLDGQERVMKEGEELVILPGIKHWAKGDAAWVQVDCTPPWTPDDHILDPKKD
jgi:mannose-6-phosphate isomerase-like protein (cupin superfamily)